MGGPKQNNKAQPFRFIDLFAGIGGFRIALQRFGGKCVFSSEWDKHSQSTYLANFGEMPQGDITRISERDVPEHDVLCAGFPCQAFSISGKRLGFEDTRGTLFRDVARIAKCRQPKVLFLENVKNLLRHQGGNTIRVILETLREVGYNPFVQMLRSSDFGVPQARERIYIVAFRKDLNVSEFTFPRPNSEPKVVKDALEPDPVDEACYIKRSDISFYRHDRAVIDPRRPLQVGKINKGGQGERIYSIYAAGITLSAYGGGAASKTGAYLVDGRVRKLTPRECANLQGFPRDFILPANRNLAYKQFGDSVSIPVIDAIFGNVLKACPSLAGEPVPTEKKVKPTAHQLSLHV
jgi:DNA (cytosine-5)-methyltransferase 1